MDRRKGLLVGILILVAFTIVPISVFALSITAKVQAISISNPLETGTDSSGNTVTWMDIAGDYVVTPDTNAHILISPIYSNGNPETPDNYARIEVGDDPTTDSVTIKNARIQIQGPTGIEYQLEFSATLTSEPHTAPGPPVMNVTYELKGLNAGTVTRNNYTQAATSDTVRAQASVTSPPGSTPVSLSPPAQLSKTITCGGIALGCHKFFTVIPTSLLKVWPRPPELAVGQDRILKGNFWFKLTQTIDVLDLTALQIKGTPSGAGPTDGEGAVAPGGGGAAGTGDRHDAAPAPGRKAPPRTR